jgi:DNA-binding transcriptional ArsR family regulator
MHVKQHRKRKRDAHLRIMRRLVKGPVYPRDLQKELKLSRGTVNHHLGLFLEHELAKKLKDKRYAFITYLDGEEAVIRVIEKWKNVAFRYPTSEEIANEVGIPLQDAETLARKTKAKTAWSMPNQAILSSSTEKLGEILVCAARVRDGKLSSFDYEQDSEIIEEAKIYLKKHTKMLPKLDGNGQRVISWSSTALKYLGRIYKPKDRLKGVLL